MDCKEILLEFSLTNPCRTALLKSKPPEPLLAAKDRFTNKMAKFNKVDDDHSKTHLDFYPIIIESYGAIHPTAVAFLDEIIEQLWPA